MDSSECNRQYHRQFRSGIDWLTFFVLFFGYNSWDWTSWSCDSAPDWRRTSTTPTWSNSFFVDVDVDIVVVRVLRVVNRRPSRPHFVREIARATAVAGPILRDCTEFYRVFLFFSRKAPFVSPFFCFVPSLPSFTGFYRVLPSFIEFDQILEGFTGFNWVLTCFAGFLLEFTGFYWVMPILPGLHQVWPGLTGF